LRFVGKFAFFYSGSFFFGGKFIFFNNFFWGGGGLNRLFTCSQMGVRKFYKKKNGKILEAT